MEINKLAHSPFEALLDAAVDGIVVINAAGMIETMNASAANLFGYNQEEIMGKNVSELMPEPDRTKHDEYLQNYLTTGIRKMIGIGRKTVGKRKNGDCFPMYLSVGHIEESGLNRFVGIIRDLTEQEHYEREKREAESETRQLRERLGHVARISTMGEMATGIAHEINQPLTAIATYAQACQRMIGSESFDTVAIVNALDKIDSQARRASKVITSIRHLSKKQPMDCHDYKCIDLINEVVVLAEAYAHEKGIFIELDFSSIHTEQKVSVDTIQTQQVLLNLINNSIESMATDTKETDELEREAKKKPASKRVVDGSDGNDVPNNIIVVSANVVNDTMIEIAVADSGKGIEAVDEDQLFDAFFTTKPSGLGMGLSICQSIVTAQGGKIRYQRNNKKGVTFAITLPMSIGENL